MSAPASDSKLDQLATLITSLGQTVATLAATQATAAASSGQNQSELLTKLAEAAGDGRRGLRADKPRLSATDPATLYVELRAFRRYMNDNRWPERIHWFTGARNIATDRARTCIEAYIVQCFGKEEDFQSILIKYKSDGDFWLKHWLAFESRLKMDTGLDDSNEVNEAVRVYGRVVLTKPGSVEACDKFLQEYAAARTLMIETGLIRDGDPLSTTREMEDLRTKCEGTDFLKYWMDLPEYPTEVDNNCTSAAKTTFLGRMRQYIAARRRPGLLGRDDANSSNVGGNQALFLKQTIEEASKDKKLMQSVRKMLGGKGVPAGSDGNSLAQPDAALAFDDGGKRFRAARDSSGGKGKDRGGLRKGKGKDRGGLSKGKGGSGDCPRCQGVHPECRDCPNAAASQEKDFDVSKCAKEKIPCWYQHPGANRKCGGFGHLARHHAACYTPEAEAAVKAAKLQSQGGGSKGRKRGRGKGGKDQRLDFCDGHETEQGNADNKALRLLDALLCFDDRGERSTEDQSKFAWAGFGSLSSGQGQPCVLDFGRGPSGEKDLSRIARLWLQVLHWLSLFRGRFRLFLMILKVALLLVLVAVGMPLFSSTPAVDQGLKHGMVGVMNELGQQGCNSSATMLAMKLPGGYNCRGYTWTGKARCETIFDTGATRNSVDKEYLVALLENKDTSTCVEDVVEIEPLTVTAFQRDRTFEVNRMAFIWVTFKESSAGGQQTKKIGFCVVPNSTENLLLGQPTLDELGFVSDKMSIELRALGLRFATVLRSEERV